MTEKRMTPERRAEIENGDTPAPQLVRGHQLTDREVDVRDLLAEVHALEAENRTLREGLENIKIRYSGQAAADIAMDTLARAGGEAQ